MSVTFWAPEAPTIQCTPYPDEPDYIREDSTLPEVNVSNLTAMAVLRALSLPEDYCGTIRTGSEMAAVMQRLLVLVNDESARKPVTIPAEERPRVPALSVIEPDGEVRIVRKGAPRVFSPGLSDDRLRGCFLRLQALFAQAQENGYDVSWG